MPMSSDFSELECYNIVTGLQNAGINFLAIDFDQTLVGIHTRGEYEGTSSDLCAYVRPFFRTFVPMSLNRGNEEYTLFFLLR